MIKVILSMLFFFRWRIALFFSISIGFFACGAVKPGLNYSDDLIVETFSLEGRIVNNRLFVPVVIDNKEFLFLLDTGASATVVASSIPLKEKDFLGSTPVGSIADFVFAKSFRLKNAYMGSVKIPEEPTYVMNFENSQESPRQFDGIIGVSALKDFVITIDKKKQKIDFLRQLPSDVDESILGKEYPVFFDQAGRPNIYLDIPYVGRSKILVDTGAELTSFNADMFNKAAKDSKSRVAKITISGASGSYLTDVMWMDELMLAQGLHHDVEIVKSSTSLIGMDVLSHYIITIDFPNKKLYLKSY